MNILNGFLVYGALQVIGFILAFLALYILLVVIQWKLFTKAGEAGWKALIPVYNQYILFKICWSTKWFWFLLGSSVAMSIGMLIPLLGPILFVAGILVFMFTYVFECLQLAKAFCKEESYGIGLVLLRPIFEFILAFDHDVKYIGAQKDPHFFSSITSDLKDEINSLKKEKPTKEMKFDPYTGEPINRKEPAQESEIDEDDELIKALKELTKEDVDDVTVIEPGNLN